MPASPEEATGETASDVPVANPQDAPLTES